MRLIQRLALKSLIFTACFTFLVCQFSWGAPQDGPIESLREISAAIAEGNAVKFEQYVDIDAIISQGLDTFLKEIKNSQSYSQFGPILSMLFSSTAAQNDQSIRRLLTGELHAFITNGIANGSFGGRTGRQTQSQGFLAPLFANASMGRKEIREIGKPVTDGNDSLIDFKILDYGNGNLYPITGRFASVNGHARLVKIENLDQLVRQIQKEATMSD